MPQYGRVQFVVQEGGEVSGGRVLMALDAAPEVGVGHAIRCQALAEELIARGLSVSHVGRMEVDWVAREYACLGVEAIGQVPVAEAANHPDVVAVVLDSYTLPVNVSRSLRALGKPVLIVVDDTTRGLDADVVLEQNLGSTPGGLGVSSPTKALCGPRYALLRDLVLAARTDPWQPPVESRPARVAVLFGGTDPAHGAPVVAGLLARTRLSMDVKVMAASASHRSALASISWAPGQRVSVVEPDPNFVRSVANADLVVSAGGSTVYELMALGRPAAICTVADNQVGNYGHLVTRGVAAGLGPLDRLRAEPERGAALLGGLLEDTVRLEGLARQGFALIDGRGKSRVVDELISIRASV